MSLSRKSIATITPNISGVETIAMIPRDPPPTYQEGKFFYNDVYKTFSFFTDRPNSSLEIGQEMWLRSLNNTGVDMSDGDVVYISGASGNSPEISLAIADKKSTSSVIGVLTENIVSGAIGIVTRGGLVHNINTSLCEAGDIVYLSPTTAGTFTKTKPTGLNSIVRVGVITHVGVSDGVLLVDPVDYGRADSPTAEMYHLDNTVATTINTVNVWERVQKVTQAGILLGFIHNGAGLLTADVTKEDIAGNYDVSCAISSRIAGTNKTYEYGIAVNGTVVEKTRTVRKFSTSDVGSQNISGIIEVPAGGTVALRVRNVTDDTDIIVVSVNMNIIKIGA